VTVDGQYLDKRLADEMRWRMETLHTAVNNTTVGALSSAFSSALRHGFMTASSLSSGERDAR
jgi:hypothetical protein